MGDRSSVSNVNADVPASSRKLVESLKEIVYCSNFEIYAMLMECDMDLGETVNRLLFQDTFHVVKSKRDKKKEARRNRSNETGSVQATRGGFSSAPGVLERQPPSNSDPHPTNTEVKKTASDEITSSSLPSHVHNANMGKRTMADVVKMGRPLHQKNVDVPRSSETPKTCSASPLKDEWPSIEKQDVAESEIPTDQLSESQHLDDAHLDDENNKEEEHAFKENGGEDVYASVATGFQQLAIEDEGDKPEVIIPSHLQAYTLECSHLKFGSFGSREGYGQSSGLNYNLEETQKPVDEQHGTDYYGEEEEQLRKYAASLTDGQSIYQNDSETEAVQHEPPQEDHQQYRFPSSADYIFENSQQLNPHYSPFPERYNTTTPSSLSFPAITMAEALSAAEISHQQATALAQHFALSSYSHQPEIPLGHYGNLISYPFMPQSYNPYMPASSSNNFPVNLTNSETFYEDVNNHLALSLRQQQIQQQQQPSQPFGGYGYVSPYHFQAAVSLDHLHHEHQEQQDVGDASKQSQQQLEPNSH
ncbi:unnamed protein product [Microthlaspi erraticum]|uniref:GBF-interacting protein 1 N-terminal domain-containing protein n=1 Tax=Microthlaspi erraticum TaxID=1685480 RepID=A0A6D2K0B3_9BRAS|nr:unnamed protein product [Microthlaspi erraticum]